MNIHGKLMESRWFAESICIVRVKLENNQNVYYIGYSDHHDHDEAEIDVMLWGVPFPKNAGDVLFNIQE